nr:hypothetical protein [Gammaproteobacteria bacterium]
DSTTGVNIDATSTLRTRLTGVLGTVLQFDAVDFDDILNADGTRRGILEYTFTRSNYDKYILNDSFEYCVTTVNTLPSRAILVLQQTVAERAQIITDLDEAEATRTGVLGSRAQRVDVLFKPIAVIADTVDRVSSRTQTAQTDLVLGTVPLTNINVSQLSFIREVVPRTEVNIVADVPLTFENVRIQGFTTDNGDTTNVDRIDFLASGDFGVAEARRFFASLPQRPGRFELRLGGTSYFYDFPSLFQYTDGDRFITIPAVSLGTVRFPLTMVDGDLIYFSKPGFNEVRGGNNVTLDVDTPNVLTINTPDAAVQDRTIAWAIASTGEFTSLTTVTSIGGQSNIIRIRYNNVIGTGYMLPGETTEDPVWFEFIGVALNTAGTAFDLKVGGSVYSSHLNPFDPAALTIRAF